MGRKSEKSGCHQCRECGSAFTRIQNLNRHQRNHEGVKRHRCSECGEVFSRADLVRRHQQRAHDGFVPKIPPKACKFCSTSKVRCDRQSPCSQCQSKGIICEPRGVTSAQGVAPAARISNQIGHRVPYFMNNAVPTSSSSSTVATALPVSLQEHLEPAPVNQISPSPLTTVQSLGRPNGSSGPPFVPSLLFDCDTKPDISESHLIHDQSESPSGFNNFPNISLANDWISTGCLTSTNLNPARNSPMYWPTINPNIDPPSPLHSAVAADIPASVPTCCDNPLSYFTSPMVELFLQLYLKYFNPHWPLVDPTTFRNSDISAPLTVAMCCIGAMYDSQSESKRLATAVMLVQRPTVLSKMVTHCLNEDETLSALQTLFLYQVFGSFHEEEYHRSLSTTYHGSLVQLLRQSKLLGRENCIIQSQNAAVQTQKSRNRRRVVYGIYFLDMLQPILNGSPASLSVDEMSLQMPVGLGSFQSSPSLFILFSQLLDADQKVMVEDKSQALLLLVALIGEVFDFLRVRHSMLASCAELAEVKTQTNQLSSSTEQTLKAVYDSLRLRQQSLEAAHCRWKGLWDALDQVDVEGAPWTYKNAMPFYIIGFLALSYSNSGMEWEHSTANHDSESSLELGGNRTFSQFCSSFRHCLNEADWCGVPWLFPLTQ